ncbi:hypothetical protein B0H17DRAFT_1191800 [Mycena rosella]|uniref:Uncharacterized protein n=1 Tax=Mycena rosella TaxID=1033263 RepID=A0AAD7GZD9_MYCRO|nr:hypothetical protein B0H17DRAFT_1191800 [Mycena rosella]
MELQYRGPDADEIRMYPPETRPNVSGPYLLFRYKFPLLLPRSPQFLPTTTRSNIYLKISLIRYLPTARAVDSASAIAMSASRVGHQRKCESHERELPPTPTPSINPWVWVPPLNILSWTPLLIFPFFVEMFNYMVYTAWKALKPDAPNPKPSKAQTTRSFSERMAEVRARMGDADIAQPAPAYTAAADNAAPGSDRFTAISSPSAPIAQAATARR